MTENSAILTTHATVSALYIEVEPMGLLSCVRYGVTMRRWEEFAAGAGLGGLVGILIGLSSSPIVVSVVSALIALLASFFGLSGDKSSGANLLRIFSFAFLCTAGLLFGVTARTRAWLSPSPTEQMRKWTAAGFSTDRAKTLVAYQNLGVVPANETVVEAPKSASSVLFGDASSSECGNLLISNFRTRADQMEAMRHAGGSWKKLADSLRDVDGTVQQAALDAAYGLVCP